MYSQSIYSCEILKMEKSKWTTVSSHLCLYKSHSVGWYCAKRFEWGNCPLPLPAMHVQCPNHLKTDSVPGRALYSIDIYIYGYPRNLGPQQVPWESVRSRWSCHNSCRCLGETRSSTTNSIQLWAFKILCIRDKLRKRGNAHSRLVWDHGVARCEDPEHSEACGLGVRPLCCAAWQPMDVPTTVDIVVAHIAIVDRQKGSKQNHVTRWMCTHKFHAHPTRTDRERERER